ncbi:hypothetical protein MYX82_14475, partial [Acidobacteria bacterium AH-259-D05]|nr:hypothetical protein [Acidobacteria bacterium AH-259-D05]
MKYRLDLSWVSLIGTGLICLVLGSPAFAGGPRSVINGQTLKWSLPVRFTIDDGPLGTLTRDQGAELVRQAFQKWVDVPTSEVRFADQGFLDIDLTAENFKA